VGDAAANSQTLRPEVPEVAELTGVSTEAVNPDGNVIGRLLAGAA
jgi:hypothetical protein